MGGPPVEGRVSSPVLGASLSSVEGANVDRTRVSDCDPKVEAASGISSCVGGWLRKGNGASKFVTMLTELLLFELRVYRLNSSNSGHEI